MAREAKSGRVNEELLVTQINNARESIKGVDIDSELIQ
jgi:flagellar hook-associated protein FlgK